VTNYVLPSIRAKRDVRGQVPPRHGGCGRPLIAAKLVEVAEKEGGTAVAPRLHGEGQTTRSGIDVTVRALDPSLKVIAPVREWNMSRDQELIYAKEHGIKVKPSNSIYSIDQNLWGRSIESGRAGGPPTRSPRLARSSGFTQPKDAPDAPGTLSWASWRARPRASTARS